MKAKKKPLETLDAASLGVPLQSALQFVKFEAPATRSRGVMVKDAQELVDALKKKGLL